MVVGFILKSIIWFIIALILIVVGVLFLPGLAFVGVLILLVWLLKRVV
jgi:hypothetical protein